MVCTTCCWRNDVKTRTAKNSYSNPILQKTFECVYLNLSYMHVLPTWFVFVRNACQYRWLLFVFRNFYNILLRYNFISLQNTTYICDRFIRHCWFWWNSKFLNCILFPLDSHHTYTALLSYTRTYLYLCYQNSKYKIALYQRKVLIT